MIFRVSPEDIELMALCIDSPGLTEEEAAEIETGIMEINKIAVQRIASKMLVSLAFFWILRRELFM